MGSDLGGIEFKSIGGSVCLSGTVFPQRACLSPTVIWSEAIRRPDGSNDLVLLNHNKPVTNCVLSNCNSRVLRSHRHTTRLYWNSDNMHCRCHCERLYARQYRRYGCWSNPRLWCKFELLVSEMFGQFNLEIFSRHVICICIFEPTIGSGGWFDGW